MYEITKSVIADGRYELAGMLRRLDILWVQGDLTDDQRTELTRLAREHADPAMNVDLLKAVEALDKRVAALEQGGVSPAPAPDPAEPNATPEYPAYDKDHGYVSGEKCTSGGRHWICTPPEHVEVVWFSPGAYPAYWQEV